MYVCVGVGACSCVVVSFSLSLVISPRLLVVVVCNPGASTGFLAQNLSASYAVFELCGPTIQAAPLGSLQGFDSCLHAV